MYGNIDGVSWFSSIRSYLVNNYQRPTDIIEYFHLFLDSEFYPWFFKLSVGDKACLDKFESSFLEEIYRLQSQYEDLVIFKQEEFLKKINSMFKSNKSLMDELKSTPLSSYLKLKIMIIRKVYPKILKEDAVRMCIYSITDNDKKKKLVKFINSDFDDILSLASSIDLYESH